MDAVNPFLGKIKALEKPILIHSVSFDHNNCGLSDTRQKSGHGIKQEDFSRVLNKSYSLCTGMANKKKKGKPSVDKVTHNKDEEQEKKGKE